MSRDSFLNRTRKRGHAAFRRSREQERSLAERSGGRLVPRSGAGPEKGDVRGYSGVFRVEAKTTSAKSFSITQKMLDAIESAAAPYDELPAIIVEFVDSRGRPLREVAVVPIDVLESLNVLAYRDGDQE